MNTKLTLSIDNETILAAKQHAKHRRISLSQLIGNYLQSLPTDSDETSGAPRWSTRVKHLKGSIKLNNAVVDEKQELRKVLRKKYL